ncbi:hypothetical protein [Salinisphaera orenii]|uniref:Uncharacterized protein n=1 Tax=Salinisphaera orenii YIM 95161 TaxID=1051139 RepID=A0A423PRU3_9GAMM|nr:hypothetical protein [Salinisphaera halophila]ROO28272.1 hypothetical protein SAHL_10760 [Salinisphaera halophila YIM 95161]
MTELIAWLVAWLVALGAPSLLIICARPGDDRAALVGLALWCYGVVALAAGAVLRLAWWAVT